MRFSAYFILISYLMAGTGLVAVSLTSIINPAFLAATGILICLSFILSLFGKPVNIPRFIWNSLAIIILAAGLIDYIFISLSLIDTSVRFLTLLMVVKLFDLKTNRDYATLYLLTFFQLLAASASTINLSFLFALALYILTGIWALTIFNLKRDWEEKSASHKEIAKNILSPYFFITTAGLAALSLIITLSLFFVIPRMGVGFFPKQTADTIKISGFSEKIDMGDLGAIKLDPSIVMRVELSGHKPSAVSRLYFRGMAFDTYHGAQWQQTIKEMTPLQRNNRGIWGVKESKSQRVKVTEILTQIILLEAIETNVLFAASTGIGISGNFSHITSDRMGSFYLPAPFYSRIEYTAYSLLPASPESILPEQNYSQEVPWQYLQTPSEIERVSSFTKDITSDKKTPLDKAISIEAYLKTNYRYTLSPAIPDRSIRGQKGKGKNPVEDFLFHTKAGYCEQYAAAMAIMLRTVGIPSRLVTGFLPGEWNKFGNYFIIRNRDAHSWVEAYLPGAGWTTFDPTPSADTVGAIPVPTSVLTLYIDALRWRWNRYIVNYSFQDQINLAKTVEGRGRSLMSKLRGSFNTKTTTYTWKDLLILITATALTAIILISIRSLLLKAHDKTRWPNTPSFYRDMLMLLAKKGKIKKTGETALEFADSLDIEGVKAVTDIYYMIRFGGHKPTDEEKARIAAYLMSIRKALP